jgi:hypothetical protein
VKAAGEGEGGDGAVGGAGVCLAAGRGEAVGALMGAAGGDVGDGPAGVEAGPVAEEMADGSGAAVGKGYSWSGLDDGEVSHSVIIGGIDSCCGKERFCVCLWRRAPEDID